MLIKRVYEVDPLSCPQCGGQTKVVAFIEPPQGEVFEEILRGHQSGAMVGGLCNRRLRGRHPTWMIWSSSWMPPFQTAQWDPRTKPTSPRN